MLIVIRKINKAESSFLEIHSSVVWGRLVVLTYCNLSDALKAKRRHENSLKFKI